MRVGRYLAAFLAAVALLENACDGYLSTMHLGHTLKAFRTTDLLEHQQQEKEKQEQQQHHQQQQQELERFPSSSSSSTSKPQNLEGNDDGEQMAPAVATAGTTPSSQLFAGVSSVAVAAAAGAAHPSWSSTSSSPSTTTTGNDGGDENEEEFLLQSSTRAEAKSLCQRRRNDDADRSATDCGRSLRSQQEEVEVHEQEEFEHRMHPPEGAASPTSTTTTTGTPGRTYGGDEPSVASNVALSAATAVGTPSCGVDDAGVAALSDQREVAHQEEERGGGTITPTKKRAHQQQQQQQQQRAATASTNAENADMMNLESTDVLVLTRDFTAGDAPSTAAGLMALDLEDDQNNKVYDKKKEEEEDVETTATRELLRQRGALDRKVQEAAARDVKALPAKQQDSFDEVKAFAFGADGRGGGSLSEEDVRALDTVAICGDRDGVVLAFLRHSKFDAGKAKESMRRCAAWRRENKTEEIFTRGASKSKMQKYRMHWPTGFHKQDHAGRPVFYDRVGLSDLSALRAEPNALDQDEMVQIFCQNMEVRRRFVLTRFSREAGRPVDQITTVLDLTGLGMRHLSKEAVSYTRRISEIFQDNFSGMTCSLLVVNAPWVFSKGWQVIEGFLSEETVAKVKVLGKGEAGLKELEKHIPRENIPDFLGGESISVVGPADPLWVEVDAAMAAWARGEDPFLDPNAVREISDSIIARERTRAAAASATAASASAATTTSVAASSATAVAAKAGTLNVLSNKDLSEQNTAVGKRVLPNHLQQVGDGSEDEEDREEKQEEFVQLEKEVGVEVRAKVVKPGRVRSEARRKAEVGRRKGGHRRRSSSGKVGRVAGARGKVCSSHAKDNKTNKISSRGDALDVARSRRRETKTTADADGGTGGTGRASFETRGAEEEAKVGVDGDHTLPGRTKRKAGGKRKMEVEMDDDRRSKRKALGETVIEGLIKDILPVLKAVVLQVWGALMAAWRVLLDTLGGVFRFLRDSLFEQVEIEN